MVNARVQVRILAPEPLRSSWWRPISEGELELLGVLLEGPLGCQSVSLLLLLLLGGPSICRVSPGTCRSGWTDSSGGLNWRSRVCCSREPQPRFSVSGHNIPLWEAQATFGEDLVQIPTPPGREKGTED
jgi:hypothetical protein